MTIAQILATAAAVAGRQVRSARPDRPGAEGRRGGLRSEDQRGPRSSRATRPTAGECDLYLGCDSLVAADAGTWAWPTPGARWRWSPPPRCRPGRWWWTYRARSPRVVGGVSARIRCGDPIAAGAIFVDARKLSVVLLGSDQFANMFLTGAAFQAGALPAPGRCHRGGDRLNGVQVRPNLQAFRRGRQYVADPEAFARSGHGPERRGPGPAPRRIRPAADLLRRRHAEARNCTGSSPPGQPDLIEYQNVGYARRYADLVARVREAEVRSVPEKSELSQAVAEFGYKLMAYKDEIRGRQAAHRSAGGGGGAGRVRRGGPRLLPAPPAGAAGPGHATVTKLGPWSRPGFRLLQAGKIVRGTRLDPFGHTRVRRVERELIREYTATIDDLLGPAERRRPTRAPSRSPGCPIWCAATRTSSSPTWRSTGPGSRSCRAPRNRLRLPAGRGTNSGGMPMFRVDSEVGCLRQVVLHRPDLEFKRLTPDNAADLLFDDVLWVSRQAEHARSPMSCARGAWWSTTTAICWPRRWTSRRRGRTSWTRCSTRVGTARSPPPPCGPRWRASTRSLARFLAGGITKREIAEFGPSRRASPSIPSIPTVSCSRRCRTCSTSGTRRAGSTAGYPSTRCASRPDPGDRQRQGHLPLAPDVRAGGFQGLVSRRRRRAATIEGGDILVIGNGAVLIGMSERTTPQAVEMLAHRLFAAGAARCLVAIDMPKTRAFMHLDTRVDDGRLRGVHQVRGNGHAVLVHGRAGRDGQRAQGHRSPAAGTCTVPSPPRSVCRDQGAHRRTGRRIPRRANSGTMAATCGAAGSGRAYERNVPANTYLQDDGIEVITVPGGELAWPRRPRCMSCPIERDA